MQQLPRLYRRRLFVVMLAAGLLPVAAWGALGHAALERFLSVSLEPLVTLLGRADDELQRKGGEAALREDDWPGNVRELRNFVERVSLTRTDSALRIGAEAAALLRPGSRASGTPSLGEKSYAELVEGFERATLRAALDRCGGNIAAAARLLRMDRGNLHRRLKALDLIERP